MPDNGEGMKMEFAMLISTLPMMPTMAATTR
jgi:hypothetical protein